MGRNGNAKYKSDNGADGLDGWPRRQRGDWDRKGGSGKSRVDVVGWMIVAAFESDYKEIMRGIESIKGNWFAILNKRGDDDYSPRCGWCSCCFDVPSSLALWRYDDDDYDGDHTSSFLNSVHMATLSLMPNILRKHIFQSPTLRGFNVGLQVRKLFIISEFVDGLNSRGFRTKWIIINPPKTFVKLTH